MNYTPLVSKAAALTITELAIAIQNKGIGTAFVDLHLHVGILSVRVYSPEWSADAIPSYSNELYLGDDLYSEIRYKSIVNQLQTILKEN